MSDRRDTFYGGFLSPGWRTVRATLLSTIFILSSGCLNSGDQACEPEKVNRVIAAIDYKNGHDVYFAVNDLDFLFDPTFVVEDISLEGVMSTKHKDSDDYSFDINGTKISRCDGERNQSWNCGSITYDSKNQSRFCSKMHKYSLNGGLSILLFMAQVKFQKGNLRMSVHGHSDKLVSAQLVIKGTKHGSCVPPKDPPPPAPVAPVTTISAYTPTESPSNSTSKSITFAADQTGVQYFCSVDGAAAAACSSPKVYSNLANGSHTFKVYATNSAGLSDKNPPTLTWTVDSVTPTVTITNASSLPTLTNATTISVAFTSSEAASYSCKLDNGSPVTCTSPFAPTGIGEGAHRVSISAVDAVGNVSTNPATYQWVVDLTVPVTQINSVDPAAPVNNAAQMTILFSGNETSDFYCSVDNAAYNPCSSPFFMMGVAEGQHWFSVRATDLAGNQGLPSSYSWKTDLTAPVISLVNAVPAPGNSNARNVTVEFAIDEIAKTYCSLDGSEPMECSSPFITTIVMEGAHSLVVTAIDGAGNAAVPLEIDWMMDYTSPALSFGEILPSTSMYLNSDGISLEVLSTKTVSLSASVNGSPASAFTSPLVLSGLPEGAYEVKVSGVDAVGNSSAPISHSFVIDRTAPQLMAQAQITGLTTMDSNTLTFSASEEVAFTCNVDEAGFGACVSPLALSGLAEGLHVVHIRATDLAGNVSQEASLEWTVDTVAPVTGAVLAEVGYHAYSFTLSSSEDGSTFKCSLDGGALQSCSSPVAISGVSVGDHSFFVQATDVAGNVDKSGVMLNFSAAAPTTSASVVQISANAFKFSFSSNAPGATFMCAIDGNAASACAAIYTVSGFEAGNHVLVVRATDADGNADPTGASVSVFVRPPVSTTLISQVPAAQFTNSKSISFTFSSNHNDATFVCSLNGAAAAPCVSPMVYSNLGDGAKTFKVQAVDVWGGVDPVGASYSWTVDTVGPAIVTISTSSMATIVDVTWTTNEPSTTKLFWGVSPNTPNVVPEDSTYKTSHSVHLTGLSPNTLYTLKPAGTDRAGNAFVGGTVTARTSR